MTAVGLVSYILAVWRLSSLLVWENGPFRVFARMRSLAGADRPGELTGWAELFSCVWCMSVWAAIAIWVVRRTPLVWLLAASAGAVVLEKHVRE